MFIDELTPEEIKEQRCEESVEVFCESSGQLDWVKLAEPAELIDKEGQSSAKMLVMNQTPYVQRGWCVAEQEWSATRNSMSKPPTRPEDFERKAANGHLKFTHRSDLDLVLKLQKLVFLQKITNCTCYFYSDSVWDTHVSVFVGILPCFVSLRELRIAAVDLSKDFHEENLAIALANLPMLEELDLYCILTKQRGVFLAKALKNMKLRVLSLQHCSLDDTGYAALAESLETHPTLKFLLAGNNPSVRSYCFGGPGPEILRLTKHTMSANVTAKLAAALHCNSSLERVLLTDRFMGRSREELLGLFMDNRCSKISLISRKLSLKLRQLRSKYSLCFSEPKSNDTKTTIGNWEIRYSIGYNGGINVTVELCRNLHESEHLYSLEAAWRIQI